MLHSLVCFTLSLNISGHMLLFFDTRVCLVSVLSVWSLGGALLYYACPLCSQNVCVCVCVGRCVGVFMAPFLLHTCLHLSLLHLLP